MRQLLTSLVGLLVCASATIAIPPSAPRMINYQGRLTDASGTPLPDGVKSVRLIVWNDATLSAPGNQVWNSGTVAVTTTGGLFTVQLGALPQPALTPTILTDTSRWLGITVGADPEISPRVRLVSVPYAYNSENAQFASNASIAVYADSSRATTDRYVNIIGDTMTGALAWDANKAGIDALIETGTAGTLTLATDGESRAILYGQTYGTLYLYDQDGSRTVSLNASPASGGQLSLYQEDASYGLLMYGGSTTNGSRLYMYSQTGSPTIQIDADGSGDAAAYLPDSAISSREIRDEPGIAVNDNGTGSVVLTTTMQDIVTVQITIPTAGYIVLDGKATGWTSGTTDQNYGYVQIDETAGGTSAAAPYVTFFGSFGMPNTEIYYWPVYVTRTYYKSTAGTYTFRIEAMVNASQGAGATTRVFYGMLRAMYVPTAYGAVNTLVASGEQNQFENAVVESYGGPGPENPVGSQTTYRVDLRELELKAARAEAEAERARRELLDAKLREQTGNDKR